MGSSRAFRPLAAGLLGLAALWLAWPVLTCVHVEGFTASIASIALHLTHDSMANYDRLFPFNLQFFAYSRLGTNLFVALLVGPFGLPAEWAMRATMGFGLACLAGGTFVLVRRWTKADPLVIALAMVLTPGVVETGYYYNDNLLSAGLAAVSLAILASSARPWATIAAGALFGYAVLARTDSLLLAPAAALMLWRREGLNARLALHWALFGAASAGLASAILAVFGMTPFMVLKIAAHAVALWDRHADDVIQVTLFVLFAGLTVLELAAVGLVALVRDKRLYLAALLAGTPLLYNLVYWGKVWEARQFAPLTPFLVALAVVGLQTLLAARTLVPRVLALLIAASAVVLLVAPPSLVAMWEGPRSVGGRLWAPMMWRAWQASARASFDALGGFVDHPPAPVTAIVTDYWDADRYTHLQAQETGYRPIDVGATWPACAGIAEAYQRGAARIVQIRLHVPYLKGWDHRLAPRFEGPGRACLAEVRPGASELITSLSRMDGVVGGTGPNTPWITQARRLADGRPWMRPGDLDPLAGRPLTPELAAALPALYRRAAAATPPPQGPLDNPGLPVVR